MAWLTEEEFREIYVTDSATEIKTAQVEQCLAEAKDEIGSLCGADVIDEIEAAAAAPTDAAAIRKYDALRRAQGKLSYAELLVMIIGARARSGGIMITERDENNSVTNSYENFSQIEKRAAALRASALRILQPYFSVEEIAVEASEQSYTSSVPVSIVW